MAKEFTFKIRTYYEDTDLGQIVYHANYLKYAERARTEILRDLGINQSELLNKNEGGFLVIKADIDYFAPATLDDLLTIKTKIIEIKHSSVLFEQNIFKREKKLTTVKILVAFVNNKLKPIKMPKAIKDKLM